MASMKARRVSLGERLAIFATTLIVGCAARGATPKQPSLDDARSSGESSSDAEVTGTWLVRELVSPGGDATRAKRARGRLDQLVKGGKGGMVAALAQGMDDAM